MTDTVPTGQRYSLLYLKPDEAISDSPRLRTRLAKLFEATIRSDDGYKLGTYLEEELGIDVLRFGTTNYYISWDEVRNWELRDLLCTITLIGRYSAAQRTREASQYPAKISRILAQECTSYRVDEKCGVHPSVDTAYQANIISTVRGLGQEAYTATREYIQKADDNLMPEGDRREAIRAAFDAVENVFKMTFNGAIALNNTTIRDHLRPLIERTHADAAAKRTALKFCDSLTDWTDSCHNYRHASGEVEPTPPPEELTVALVAQGIVYVRWLTDLKRRYANG